MPAANNTPTPKAAREKMLGGFLRWSATTVFCGAVLLGTARRSAAATLTVTSTADSGVGSLRDAVASATTGDIVNFKLPPGSVINLTSGQLPITQTISITGPGATNLTINRTGVNGRIFYVYTPFAPTFISGMTLSNGYVKNGSGGGIYNHGNGILKYGGSRLTLDGVVIKWCSIYANGLATYGGGGIFNAGYLTVTNSTVQSCSITGPNEKGGGGICNKGSLSLANSTVSGCNARYSKGGGIFGAPYYSNLVIRDSTISNNYGKYGGGGIYAGYSSSGLPIQNSTIAYNTTKGNGGGILVNTGIAGLQSSIVSGNTSSGSPDDCYLMSGNTVMGYNSLVQSYAGSGTFLDNTYTCIFGQAANLASLAYNGGPTQTHKPNPGSPVIGTGYNLAGLLTDQRGAPRVVAGKVDMGAVQLQPAQALVVTNANDSGPGSLRAAASSAFDAPSTVTFSNYFSTPRTIALTTGEIPVSGFVTITGPGAANATVDAGNASRIFNIRGVYGNTITISGLTITHGAHSRGGGLYNQQNLTLDNVTVTACTAMASGGTYARGGGIYSRGIPTLRNGCVLSGNSALNATGGNAGGGGIFSYSGYTYIQNSAISGNSVTASGGAYAFAFGGGISTEYKLSIQNSSVTGNTVTASGGATSNYASAGGIYAESSLSIQNSTVSGNRVSSSGTISAAKAGGIFIEGGTSNVVENSTIVNNSVVNANGTGGGIYAFNAFTMISSIVAKNTRNAAAPVSDDIFSSAIISGSNNVVGDGTGSGLSNGSNSNQVGAPGALIDPMLAPLANNGGRTLSHVVLFGSPAIDKGLDTTDIFGAAPLSNDQRGAGFPRQIGPAVDIGAIEHDQTPPVAVLTAAPNVTFPNGPYLFSVTFTDNKAVDVATIANTNILVTGPGFSQLATIFSIVPNVSGPSIVVTYKIVPPNNIWGIAQNGVFTISILPNQVRDNEANPVAPGNLGTFTVSIPVPQFISAPMATPSTGIVGQNVQFSALVNGLGPITYNWNFGDGTSGTGNPISHVFTAAGTYTVVLTAVDSQGVPLQQTLTIIIIDPNGDNDGDGITNDVEVALGSDPLNASSTPFNIGKITSKVPLKLKKLKVQLNFGRANADVISASGQLTAPTTLLGQTMIFNIGHIVKAFTLDKRGAAVQSVGKTGLLNDKVRVSKRGVFTLSLARGTYQSFFTGDTDPARNLTSAQGTSKTRTVSVTVYFNNTAFQIDFTGPYKASKGKFGK